jgi:hypothetical protein
MIRIDLVLRHGHPSQVGFFAGSSAITSGLELGYGPSQSLGVEQVPLIMDALESEYDQAWPALVYVVGLELNHKPGILQSELVDHQSGGLQVAELLWNEWVPARYHTRFHRRGFLTATAAAFHILTLAGVREDAKRMRANLKKMGYKKTPCLPIDDDRRNELMTLAIERLHEEQPEFLPLVSLKFYLGMELKEIAELLEKPEKALTAEWESVSEALGKNMKAAHMASGGQPLGKSPKTKAKSRRRA